jgi:hypothetical protein
VAQALECLLYEPKPEFNSSPAKKFKKLKKNRTVTKPEEEQATDQMLRHMHTLQMTLAECPAG